jgi:metal-responsive CopG/Arc/MetJ family transcriptional regulator
MTRMIPVSVKIPAELLIRADIAASKLNVTRGEFIRSAVKYFLDNIEKREKRERDRASLDSKNQEYTVNSTIREKWIYIQI